MWNYSPPILKKIFVTILSILVFVSFNAFSKTLEELKAEKKQLEIKYLSVCDNTDLNNLAK
jgi:hypothetical protein